MPKKIPIKCTGSRYVPYEKLIPFQRDLKTFDKYGAEKLKHLIVKHGWITPIFVWRNKILDGDARLKALRQLMDEGYTIGDLPVIDVEAAGEKDAAEKLLAITSNYHTMTDSGLYEYLTHYNIPREGVKNCEFREFEIEKFMEEWMTESGPVIADPKIITEISTVNNFIIKCADMDELDEFKALIGTKANKKISFQKFKVLLAAKFTVKVSKRLLNRRQPKESSGKAPQKGKKK